MKVTIPGGQATRKLQAASAARIIGGVKAYGQGPTAIAPSRRAARLNILQAVTTE